MPTSAISRMENDNLTAPTLLNPNIPRHVSNVIMHGLSLVSNDRIQTITDLVTQLFDDTADDHFQQQNTTVFQNQQTPPIYTTEHYDIPNVNGNTGYTANYATQNTGYVPQQDYAEQPQEYTDDYAYDDYHTADYGKQDYGKQSYQKEDAANTEAESVADRMRLPLIIGVLLLVILLIAVVLFIRGNLSSDDSSNSTAKVTTVATAENSSQPETNANSNANSVMPMLIGKNYENQAKQYQDWIRFQVEEVYSDQRKPVLSFGRNTKKALISIPANR